MNIFCSVKNKLLEFRDMVFLPFPDIARYSHPVDNRSMMLDEWQEYLREIYGSEREITFEKFKELLEDDIDCMRNFNKCTFEYYEAGAYGCGWCTYSFCTKEDLLKYKEWFRSYKDTHN